jgi:putative oxidoreductase
VRPAIPVGHLRVGATFRNAPPESGVPKGLDCIDQDAAFTSNLTSVRRLFSSFPNGLQGWGLLLLRLTLVGGLFADAATRLHDPEFERILPAVAETLTGALLSIGLGTRVVAILACVLQLGMLPANHGTIGLHLLPAAVGICIALLGPGVWSIDARLFGRRRVEIKSLRDD